MFSISASTRYCLVMMKRIIGTPYAFPAPLGMGAARVAIGGNREQGPSETEFVAVGVNEVEEALTPFGIAGHGSWLVSRSERAFIKCVNIGNVKDYPPPPGTRMPFSANSLAQLELIPGPPPTMRATSRSEGRVSSDSGWVIFYVPVSLRSARTAKLRSRIPASTTPAGENRSTMSCARGAFGSRSLSLRIPRLCPTRSQ